MLGMLTQQELDWQSRGHEPNQNKNVSGWNAKSLGS